MSRSWTRVQLLVLWIAVLGLNTPLLAQSSTEGAIGGTVYDPVRAVVQKAQVTTRNVDTGREENGVTDLDGHFRVIRLQPGRYRVTVRAAGFAVSEKDGVTVEVGRVTEWNPVLAMAGHTDVVEVEGEGQIVQSEQHDFSTNMNQTVIDELPMNGRRWSDFALLTAGATTDGDFGLISFRGISGLLNNNTVDGTDNNQSFYSEARGRTRVAFVISSAAIQEFQVNTSNYSAEYGRAAGGVINAVTRSGSNTLHGRLFYYNRNAALSATNAFTRTTTVSGTTLTTTSAKPSNNRHQFGGTLGGPIIKRKLFYFFSYDQQKHSNPGLAVTSDPNFLTPITLQAPPSNATCNTSNLTPGQRLAACGITQAQADATVNFLVGLTGPIQRSFDEYTVLPKIDWTIRNHRLALSYNRMRWFAPAGVQTAATINRARDGFGNDISRVDSLVGRLTSTFGARHSNELRFQWGRDLEIQRPQTPLPGQPTTVEGAYPPEVCIGCSTSGSVQSGFLIGRSHSVTRIQPDEKRTQFTDTFAWSFGRHLIKFGADINHVSDMQDQLFYDSPEYSYTTLADFIVDYNAPAKKRYASFQQGFGRRKTQFATTDYNAFVADDWRVSSRLTLNLGVRYEFEKLPKPFLPNPDESRTSVFPADTNNFGPRAGFALALTPNSNKTVLRGGYGVFYGRIIGSTILNAMINTGVPGGQDTYFLYASNAAAPQYPNLLTSAPPKTSSPPSIVFFQKNFQNPLVHEADLVLEREIARGTAVSASWLFTKGTDMPVFIDQNLTPPSGTLPIRYVGGPLDGRTVPMRIYFGDRPNTSYYQMTQITSRVRSNYNAAVLQLRRRMTRGLQVSASYTWAHAIDTQQSSTTFTTGNNLFDPYDLSADKGNSSFNVPNRFVTHIVWAPKMKFENPALNSFLNNWSFAPVFTAQTGRQRDTSVGGTAPFSSKTQAGGVNGSNGWNRVPALPRNYLRLPNYWTTDLRVSRRVRLREKTTLELVAEAFNLMNHVNATSMLTTMYRWGCGTPAPTGCSNTAATPVMYFDPTVGQVNAASSYSSKERQIQLAVRVNF